MSAPDFFTYSIMGLLFFELCLAYCEKAQTLYVSSDRVSPPFCCCGITCRGEYRNMGPEQTNSEKSVINATLFHCTTQNIKSRIFNSNTPGNIMAMYAM